MTFYIFIMFNVAFSLSFFAFCFVKILPHPPIPHERESYLLFYNSYKGIL